ncbi:MAG: nucleotidyltransferase [Planctomycetes bacterium]|nr:nucleotidyltransferase [Planctomycetota bacterium]
MAKQRLPVDFREFLKSLNSKRVKYLLIGGYAVVYHGYPRATGDMDVWVETSPQNAKRLDRAIREFGFDVEKLSPDLFEKPDQIVRMGIPPMRIEVLTTISGVHFSDCYRRRRVIRIDGIKVSVISLRDLLANKKASGRTKDLADYEQLKVNLRGEPGA